MTDGTITIPIIAGLTVGGMVAQADAIPSGLRELSGAGAAVLVTAVVWFFAKQWRELSREANETTKAITADFSKTTKDAVDKFAETTTTLMREARVEAQQREERLAKLFDQFTQDKP